MRWGWRRRAIFRSSSFDDMPFAELLHPPLTTVRQPIEEMGRLGVRTLARPDRGEAQPRRRSLADRTDRARTRWPTVGLSRGGLQSRAIRQPGRSARRLPNADKIHEREDRTMRSSKFGLTGCRGARRRPPARIVAASAADTVQRRLCHERQPRRQRVQRFRRGGLSSRRKGRRADQAAAGFAERSAALAAEPRGDLDSGAWSVIFTGPGMHDNLAAVAPKHPNQKYVYFDDELKLPNVLSIKYAQNEGSYLAGALAALIATRQGGVSAVDRLEEGRAGRRSGPAGHRGLHRRLQTGREDDRSRRSTSRSPSSATSMTRRRPTS